MTKPTTRKAAERKPATQSPISIKLTDAQRIVLSGTAQRDDGAATLPERMTEKAAQKVSAALIAKGLVREVRAKAETPVWRNEAGRAYALIVTKLGRGAIKGGDDRQDEDAAADMRTTSAVASAEPSQIAASSRSGRTIPRQGCKLADVIALLGRKQGVAIEELTSATGWLPHTTRAALTGLRKRGYAIERSRAEKVGSVYRIVVAVSSALAA